MMKPLLLMLPAIIGFIACQPKQNKESFKKEIFETEKAFQQMTLDKGIAEAFYFFADKNATILRNNDSLISGNENIKMYYSQTDDTNTTVQWTPDFVEVSDCGNFGYTYGHYTWQVIKPTGDTLVNKGVFHTVWKRQPDGNWKYVWD